jgi:hypothetical protein
MDSKVAMVAPAYDRSVSGLFGQVFLLLKKPAQALCAVQMTNTTVAFMHVAVLPACMLLWHDILTRILLLKLCSRRCLRAGL